VVEIPRTAPGPERARLGFADAASAEFAFLLRPGFRLVELTDTIARYESDRRVVRVFHGRGSYELGVEVGRWVEVDGESREQVFPLRDVIALRRDPGEVGLAGTAATTAEAVRKILRQLAAWTREFAGGCSTTATSCSTASARTTPPAARPSRTSCGPSGCASGPTTPGGARTSERW
jgi:hypothetical protein